MTSPVKAGIRTLPQWLASTVEVLDAQIIIRVWGGGQAAEMPSHPSTPHNMTPAQSRGGCRKGADAQTKLGGRNHASHLPV